MSANRGSTYFRDETSKSRAEFSTPQNDSISRSTRASYSHTAERGAVLLSGGTGFIGTLLAAVLLGRESRRVVALVREGGSSTTWWRKSCQSSATTRIS